MKILMCTGGSKYSYDAIKFAAPIAKGLGAEVTLLAVEDPHEKIDAGKALEGALAILHEFKIEAKTKIRKGNAAQEILKESEEGYDLLVIGFMGMKGIADFLLGGVAVRVVEYSKIPTLIVRGGRKLSRILACLCLSKYNPQVVATTAQIAKATNSSVEILNVVPSPRLYPMPAEAEPDTLALLRSHPERAEFLKNSAKKFKEYGVEVQIKMREGFAEEEILKESKEGSLNLIVLGSHGWGLSEILLGSLSYTVAKHAEVSVLVVKPKVR